MTSGHRNLQRVFEDAFSTADLARPLRSFDGDAAALVARTVLDRNREEAAGVTTDGLVEGYVFAIDLADGHCRDFRRPFEESLIVSDSLPLAPLVLRLRERSPLFVSAFGRICGTVGRSDFLSPAARMWLFGMITLLEMRFARMIEASCPGGSWTESLSEGRLRKVEAVLAERSRGNPHVRPVDCLQFADKVQIIAGRAEIRALTRFESKRQAENVGKKLERLRNNLAHSQDVVTEDWDTIVSLAENLESVVDGPVVGPSGPTDRRGAGT